MAAKKTTKTVALTVTLKVPVDYSVRDTTAIVRDWLKAYKPRITPIKEA